MRPVDIVLNITNALFLYFHFFLYSILDTLLSMSFSSLFFLILHNLIYCYLIYCPFFSLSCTLFLPFWAYGIYFNSYANVFAYKSIVCHFWSVYYLFLFVSLNGWLFLFGCCWVLDIFCTSSNIWDLVLILGINFILLRIITVFRWAWNSLCLG